MMRFHILENQRNFWRAPSMVAVKAPWHIRVSEVCQSAVDEALAKVGPLLLALAVLPQLVEVDGDGEGGRKPLLRIGNFKDSRVPIPDLVLNRPQGPVRKVLVAVGWYDAVEDHPDGHDGLVPKGPRNPEVRTLDPADIAEIDEDEGRLFSSGVHLDDLSPVPGIVHLSHTGVALSPIFSVVFGAVLQVVDRLEVCLHRPKNVLVTLLVSVYLERA